MSEQAQQLWQQYRAFPRAIQWALAAAVVLLLFLFWDSFIRSIGDEWSLQADRIQADVRKVRDSRQLEEQFDRMKGAIVAIGPVELPGNEKQTSDALSTAINKILADYPEIEKQNYGEVPGERLGKNALVGIMGPGEVGRKITSEFEFESSPETATRIIADLERNPDIEAVSEVRISRTDNRKVAVKLKIEAWVIGRDTKSSRA